MFDRCLINISFMLVWFELSFYVWNSVVWLPRVRLLKSCAAQPVTDLSIEWLLFELEFTFDREARL